MISGFQRCCDASVAISCFAGASIISLYKSLVGPPRSPITVIVTNSSPSQPITYAKSLVPTTSRSVGLNVMASDENSMSSNDDDHDQVGEFLTYGQRSFNPNPNDPKFNPSRRRRGAPRNSDGALRVAALREQRQEPGIPEVLLAIGQVNDLLSGMRNDLNELNRRIGRIEQVLPRVMAGTSAQPFNYTVNRNDPRP